MLVCDRERDRSGARADVENRRRSQSPEQLQAAVDDGLRLRARNEHAPVDLQSQAPEAPLTENVRERLAVRAALEQLVDRDQLVPAQLPIAVEVEVGP